MNDQSKNKPSSDFLKTDGGKTKSNAIEVPSISLPKGGGAIKGIDEKFTVNAINGTSTLSLPLPFSKTRGETPSIEISYNSGAGNGIFGLGWNLSLSSIKRKTDKGLPQYLDEIDSDTYLFSGAEDLVPEFKKNPDGSFEVDIQGDYIIHENNSIDGLSTIRYYKPRIESIFARIERWTEKSTNRIKWLITTKENVTTLFGWTEKSVIANPNDQTKIYEWLPEFIFDDKGNCTQFLYKKEDETGFDDTLLHNRNRLKSGKLTYTNLYLEKVLYGNKTPYKQLGNAFPSESDFMFQTVFDYGTTDINTEPADQVNPWDFRPDAFSNYKAGFEIRTTRLCKRVLLFHVFEELALKPDKSDKKTLIKSLNFEYDTSSEQDFTFLKTITSVGYIKKSDGAYSYKSLPPMEFAYQKHDWNKEINTIDSEDIINVPNGLDEQLYQFTDLYNEGLAGILTEQANGWFYKHNLGNGKFEQTRPVSAKPSFMGLGKQLHLMDLDADGGRQLVSYGTVPTGYFELDDDNEWFGLTSFSELPNVNFNDPNIRMLDLNGDGKAELVLTEDNVFTWYTSEGRKGFSEARKTPKPFDEEEGPYVVFSDEKQTIYLTDMSGDGMTDIVRIRNGEVCYWPNLGYGNFGPKVALDNAPIFDFPDAFNPAFIRLADIDGSGTTDIIYLGKNKFTCWKNLNGNQLSTTPFEIDPFPEIDTQAKISVIDLLGNGVACIVWSSQSAKNTNAPIKYIDLMNSRKPHIMISYKNNLGKEVALEYSPSTKFYLDDKLAGKPWITKLHFPIHCVSKVITQDKISGYKFITEYKYHHGYYDHQEREFRGFGMVEKSDAETFEHWEKSGATNITDATLHQEPVISKSWHHTGAFSKNEKILHQFEREYWYEEMKREGFLVTHHEVNLTDAKLITAPGIDPATIDHLSGQEWQEAVRACKGMAIRSETFAKDAIKFGNTEAAREKELTPFSVSTRNCLIELLQPKGKNKHAVFLVKESESIVYTYERNAQDPRVAHTLNIKIDEYNNVLESASVIYPRLVSDTSLPIETQNDQNKTSIVYTLHKFTNDVISSIDYRLRLPSESLTYELKGISKTTPYYLPNDFTDILSHLKTDPVLYHEINKPLIPGKGQKRLIEHIRSIFYSNDLTAPLPLNHLESRAIHYESYQLAYTPELVNEIFGAKVTPLILTEGKFIHSEGDSNWWIRSGTIQLKTLAETEADAQDRFFMPISITDQYGGISKITYYGLYYLLVNEIQDALGNRTSVDLFNFRTLSAQRLKDINNNMSEVLMDELGLVKAVALMGKGNEADELINIEEVTSGTETTAIIDFFQATDSNQLTNLGKNLLQHASARFVYDFDAYLTTGKPAVIASITREQHFHQLADSPIQLAFEYSNGIGEVIMKKVQAEPGMAKQVNVNPDNTIVINEINTAESIPPQIRWVGNGRTVKNNKNNPVKKYEPYFSANWHYEDYKELVESSVTQIMQYDSMGRLTQTLHPNGTFSKLIFDSWKQTVYDANDTVLESDWYKKRTDNTRPDFILDVKEQSAANKAAQHAHTPNVLHYDTLGRAVLSVDHNKNMQTLADEFYATRIERDIEGNLRLVIDAKKNAVIQYEYDMLGNIVYQKSMDTGQRWLLQNITGKPLRTWDERNHEFQYYYDVAQRSIYSKIVGGDGPAPLDHVFDRVFYGESMLQANRINETNLQAKNILGQVIQHYDTAGLLDTPLYDFKELPVSTTRKLFKNYKEVANWVDANLVSDLEPGIGFTTTTQTDALGRTTQQTTPDSSIITLQYNEAGLLNSESVNHFDVLTSSHVGDKMYIQNIDYNEKGQREKITYGNEVTIRFYYNIETFRLQQLTSKRKNGDKLQDWQYTYDPVGNITHLVDKISPQVFFKNSAVDSMSTYTYDALYRLAEATGRENDAALGFGTCDNWNDLPFLQSLNPATPMAIRGYTQRYKYDDVGNIAEMKHLAPGGNWTRSYEYETHNNRLKSTHIGDNGNPADYTKYQHHAKHGYLEELPHLEKISWNFKEEVVLTSRQHCTNDNIPIITYYQYDNHGKRVRKITENQANGGGTPTKKEERIYIAGYELYKKHSGTHAGLERVSLSLIDEGHRFVMIETRNAIDDGTEKQLERYQLHNQIQSASLELDGTLDARVISYEEYHPFGTTAYQAQSKDIKSAAKRYRYTGMERDEETGLEYHSARYYLPWLGRWLSADPIGIKDGINIYAYSGNNPITHTDPNGTLWWIPVIIGVGLLLEGCDSKPKPAPAPTPAPAPAAPKISGNTVIVAGGTSVNDPKGHDKSPMNFLQAAALRAKDIKASNPSEKITVIMYNPPNLSYEKRAVNDGKPKDHYKKIMQDSAKRHGYELVIIEKASELTEVLNTASAGQVKRLEYFGHSNPKNLFLEYGSTDQRSADGSGVSTDMWGESEALKVRKDIFAATSEVNLYGCDLGDSGGLGEKIKALWGKKTTASDEKTDYQPVGQGIWKPTGNYIEMK
jgi:RHS repeat-associated protein